MLITKKRNFFPVTTALATIVFILTAIATQLYWNKDIYFAMMRAKASCLGPIAIVCVIALIVWCIEYFKDRTNIERRHPFSLLDLAVALFAISSMVTWLTSPIPRKAFNGELGMMCGSFLYMTGAVVYFIVSRHMRPAKWVITLFMGTWAVIFLWTILNQLGVDFFGMHDNMQPSELKMYVASVGNTNAASDCFCLLLPIGIILFLYSENDRMTKWLRIFIAFGVCGVLFLRAEGVLFGLLFLLPFLVMISFSSSKKTDRLLEVMLIASLAFVFFHWCTVLKGWTELSFAMQIALCYVGEIMLVGTVMVIAMRHRGKLRPDDDRMRVIGRWLTIIIIAVAGVVIFFIVYSIRHPMFATTRGAIWKGSVWAYRLYSPKELFFGKGSGFYANDLTLAFAMLMNEPAQLRYATCHDSLLQVLLSQGMFGLACFVTGIVALLRCWFTGLKKTAVTVPALDDKSFSGILAVAVFCGLICYLGCTLVESCYPHPIILFFAALGLFRSAQLHQA